MGPGEARLDRMGFREVLIWRILFVFHQIFWVFYRLCQPLWILKCISVYL